MKKSESIKEISVALSKLGSELGNVDKNKQNPFFKSKYADLASILNYVKPALAEHDLSIIQSSRPGENNSLIVETLILHSSGEWIETEVELPGEKDKKYNPQTVGSAFTYGRRYGLSAALNISSEEDTDGNGPTPQAKKDTRPIGNYQEILKHISNSKTKEELKNTYSGLSSFSWTEDETVKLKYQISQKAESFVEIDNSDLTGAADRVAELVNGEVVKS